MTKITSSDILVGIGASAGGLQAMEAFFSNLPSEPGAAFVVVQHLSPDFRSLMVELLQRRTRLTVAVVEHEMMIALNHVYVLPPGYLVRIVGQQLLLEARAGSGNDYPIDAFFLSLACERTERTIGILLSGTGHDGTEGLKAISRAGGVALVQSSETAQFGAMPSSPISSGLVDEILSPAELATAVCDIIRYASARLTLPKGSDPLLPANDLARILDIVQQQEKIDFSQYKPGTLQRRIAHRLLLSKTDSVESYVQFLLTSAEEVRHLRQDLLIGSTRFFRDPELWSLLQRDVLPARIEGLQAEQPLRLWVAACSTGEEAYSLAIAVDEVMRKLGRHHPVKLFATDIDNEALAFAAQGLYPPSIVHDIGAERLARYFVAEGNAYRIKKHIRTQIIFTSHDLIQNPGFSQIHLITCRNMLIYIQAPLQEQVLKLLHFSLVASGVLVLGQSEHMGGLAHAFQCLDQTWKVFSKRRDVTLPIDHLGHRTMSPLRPLTRPIQQPSRAHLDHLLAAVLKLRFGQQPTTCLLVDAHNQIQHVFLNTARLLEFPLGAVDFNLTDIVLPSLRLPLLTALHRARRVNEPVLYGEVAVAELNGTPSASIWVGPSDDRHDVDAPLVVLMDLSVLEPRQDLSAAHPFEAGAEVSQHVRELEFELQQTRENLLTTVQDLETLNEEMQASNEEMQASNEELQSTNEELQSVNEELYTVNSENEARIGQLTELTSDMDNLLANLDIGVVFLDSRFCIRKFTPNAAAVFDFRPSDLGRPLKELTHHLDVADLMLRLEQVCADDRPVEIETCNLTNGDPLLLRVLPYRREDGSVDGLVLTLIKVKDLKKVQRELERANAQFEELYRRSPVGLCLFDQALRFLQLNETLANINGLSIEAHLGRTVRELLPKLGERIEPLLRQVLETGEAILGLEVSSVTPDQPEVERTWLASYYPVTLQDDTTGVGAIVTEITEQKALYARLLDSQGLVQQIADASPAILFRFGLPRGGISYVNQSVETILGYRQDALIAMSEGQLWRLCHPEDRRRLREHLAALGLARDGAVLECTFRVRANSGRWRWLSQRSSRFKRGGPGQQTVQYLGVATDATESVETQETLQRSEHLLRTTLSHTPITLFTQDTALRYTWIHNPPPGFRIEDMLGRHDRDILPAENAERLTRIKQQVLDQGKTANLTFELAGDGPPRQFELILAVQLASSGERVGLTGIGIDISEAKATEARLTDVVGRLERAQHLAHVGDWEYLPQTGRVTWSPELFRLVQRDPASGAPNPAEILSMVRGEEQATLLEMAEQLQTSQPPASIELSLRTPQGEDPRHLQLTSGSVRDEAGRATTFYGTVTDITERMLDLKDIQHRAFFDGLTDLPNRSFFLQHLKLAIARGLRSPDPLFTVFYLDLDGFKEVNDSLGHAAGDQLLLETGARLRATLRPGDVIARMGGDEFALLADQLCSAQEALEIARRIQGVLNAPLTIGGAPLSVSASIGIAFYRPDDPWDSETAVLENADIAMYRAKRRGPGHSELFEPSMRDDSIQRVEIKGDLLNGIEQSQFVLYYQPLVDLRNGALVGCEALVRWRHPRRGLLAPMEFLPVARATHLMARLETWILQEATRQRRLWATQYPLCDTFRMNINVSPDFLKSATFEQIVRQTLEHKGTTTDRICLELTEESFIDDGYSADLLLRRLKTLGLLIALDDFGTGYSSLSYLHRLPIDALKIDQSFVQALNESGTVSGITAGIVGLAEKLCLSVTAEGIETRDQLLRVVSIGCHIGQGYYFSHPLPAADFGALLDQKQPLADKLTAGN
ncbi:EAL domain-containing protein [Thiocystis violacea]|uniref:EAL domain-containing protein n=1 Tax=Thiocystis violacea TaxID=13725 RepID=UPI001902F86D|nr:EAL domain-containing protein [Thiocystis violacea]MBK1721780.1 hypothetical protein [Thiocystis violacea]